MRYLAFISYRHRDKDRQISALLRKGLENHRLPSGCPLDRKRKVFRDTDELPTSSDLGADIENALKDSEWLIALCSEEYIQSKWCQREIEDWVSSGLKERILPVLISGTPETAIPESISDIGPVGDLRDLEGRELRQKTDTLINTLLSRMSGTEADAIAAAEHHFRLVRAVSIFAILAAAVFGFSLYTVNTANLIAKNNDNIREATEVVIQEKDQALIERNNALLKKAEYYAGQAWNAINEDRPMEAVRLAIEALPEDLESNEPVSESAVNALRVALYLPGRTRDDYVLIHSITPEDTITGFLPVDIGLSSKNESVDKLILSTDSDALYELTLSTGDITDYNSQLLQQSREMGFSQVQDITNNGRDTIFYGRENQMFNTRYGTVSYTLNGEPFYADRLVQSSNGGYILAWLEDPLPGQAQHAAVFCLPDLKNNVPANGAEALAEIPMAHGIRTAVFPHWGTSVAVLDNEGTLRLYDMNTGRLKREIIGNYIFAAELSNSSSALYAADAEGNGYLIDLITGDEVYRLESPEKIREIWYCEKKSCLLACCDDGIRLYNAPDGKLLKEVLMPESPLSAIWGGYDSYMFLHEGNQIALLFESQIDIDALKKDSEALLAGAKTFNLNGQETRMRTAFFSPDGTYLFLQSNTGDLSKWDISTGEMLWFKEANWSYAPSNMPSSYFSADGTFIWRGSKNGTGYERIDPETGEIIYSNRVVSSTTLGELLESPDHTIALHVKSSGDTCAFCTATGEVLWSAEDLCDNCFFSDDSSEIYFIKHTQNKNSDDARTVFYRIDAATGERLEERVLMSGSYAYFNDEFDRGSGKFVLLNDDVRKAWVITLPDTNITEYSLPDSIFEDMLSSLVSISYDGKSYIRWSSSNYVNYVMELKEDGTTGPAILKDSPEGYRLSVNASAHFIYHGEEAQLVSVRTAEGWTNRIERISDGECLLELRQGETFSFTLSPDQQSLCVYYSSRPPVLMPLTDAGTLIEQATALLGGDQE